MNKKGSGLSAFLTSAFLYAVIAFVIFLIWTGSGGGATIAHIGSFMAKIPGWVYITIALAWLFSTMRK